MGSSFFGAAVEIAEGESRKNSGGSPLPVVDGSECAVVHGMAMGRVDGSVRRHTCTSTRQPEFETIVAVVDVGADQSRPFSASSDTVPADVSSLNCPFSTSTQRCCNASDAANATLRSCVVTRATTASRRTMTLKNLALAPPSRQKKASSPSKPCASPCEVHASTDERDSSRTTPSTSVAMRSTP